MFRTLALTAIVLALASSVRAEDVDAKALLGSWKMDALALMKEDEGYKNATADEKKAMEKAAQEMSLVMEITADKITTVTKAGDKEDKDVASYKVKKTEGKVLTIETTDAKNTVEEAKFEVVDEKKMKVTIEGASMVFNKQ